MGSPLTSAPSTRRTGRICGFQRLYHQLYIVSRSEILYLYVNNIYCKMLKQTRQQVIAALKPMFMSIYNYAHWSFFQNVR